ncbi:polysaccharide deacetylase family protein [Paenibacillus yanchengensis]|uniref:Polysaccharide deacetylase family protein n=1 Tax=Paenibacillus yanchengensis TaxID=2035833 RepID=A0ABW4YFH5_9BACL
MEVRRERRRILAVVIMTLFLLIVLVSGCALNGTFGNTMETEKFQQGSQVDGKGNVIGSVSGHGANGNGEQKDGDRPSTGHHVDEPSSTSSPSSNGQSGSNQGDNDDGDNAGKQTNGSESNGNSNSSEQSNNGQETDNTEQTTEPNEGATNSGTKGNEENSTGTAESPSPNPTDSNQSSTKPNPDGKGTGTKGSETAGTIGKDKPTVDGKQPSDKKVVALTFDDGPDTKYTPAILDILQEKGVPATFYVVGTQVSKHHDIMKRIVDEGHALGNHSLSHKDFTKLSKKQLQEEIEKNDQLIKAAVGFYPNEIRAPYGALNKTVREMFKQNDRTHVAWTVDTRDWAGTSIKEMREMIRTQTKDRGIILMHSFGGKHIQNTVDMLADVIDDLQKLGFTFVTTEELFD